MPQDELGDTGPPPPAAGVVSALAELLSQLDRMGSLREMSPDIARFAVAHLHSDLAGVSLRSAHVKAVRLATSDDVLARLDEAEGALGRGPGAPTPEPVPVISVADTRTDERWPEWSAVASQRRVLATCLIEMTRIGGRWITLDLYSRTAGAFAGRELAGLVSVARLVGLTVRQSVKRTNLERALTTRDTIGRAQGIVMERYGLSSEQAMQFLRRTSQESQRKLQQIALDLVDPDSFASRD